MFNMITTIRAFFILYFYKALKYTNKLFVCALVSALRFWLRLVIRVCWIIYFSLKFCQLFNHFVINLLILFDMPAIICHCVLKLYGCGIVFCQDKTIGLLYIVAQRPFSRTVTKCKIRISQVYVDKQIDKLVFLNLRPAARLTRTALQQHKQNDYRNKSLHNKKNNCPAFCCEAVAKIKLCSLII